MFSDNFIVVVVLLCGTCWTETSALTGNSNQLGFIEANGKKYWVGNHFKVDFYEAKRRCKLYGMDLVNLNSQEKYDIVTNTVLKGATSGVVYWTSGNKINDHSNWVWADAVPMTFTHWAQHGQDGYTTNSEPNNNAGDEWCLGVAAHQGFVDWGCTANHNFICETPDFNPSFTEQKPTCQNEGIQGN